MSASCTSTAPRAAWVFGHRAARKGRWVIYFINDFVKQILSRYKTHLVLYDTVNIGFTGAAAEKPAPVFTNEVSEDVLYFGGSIDQFVPGGLVRIRSVSPQYDWMANDNELPQDTPISAIFGFFNQTMPVLPLITPFFVKKQGRLYHQFTNDPVNPITGGLITWVALRLTNAIEGGWDYSLGFN